jgi:hypothetical protein
VAGDACAAGKCATALSAGDECTASDQCGVRLYCQSGTCQPPVALGGSCVAADAVCDTFLDLYCDTSTHTCQEYQALNAATQPCGPSGIGVQSCAEGICDTTTSTCVGLAADDSSTVCGGTTFVGCIFPAQCIGGKCTLPTPATVCP